MASFNKFYQFVEDLSKKVHDLYNDQLEIYLSNATPSASADAVKADLAEISTGNGYTDPVDGQIYGPVGAQRTAFVRLYAAFGEAGVPQIITDYQGFWGSPFPSSMALADKSYSGYWKTGLYSKTNFTAATTDNRETWNKGFTQWRAADIPSNVSAAQMLAAFKGLRD